MSKAKPLKKAVFLDRDGTLNQDPGYIAHPDELQLLDGVGEALALMTRAGYELVIVTNQSGVGRGLIAAPELPRIHARLNELLKSNGVKIENFEICTHHPDDGCECRKPNPLMILRAAKRLGIDLEHSVMVGDRQSDLRAGRNAGVGTTVLVRTGDGRKTEANLSRGDADQVVDSLLDFAKTIKV